MKWDCTAVACCLAIDYLPGVRNTEIRLEFDTDCSGSANMTWSIERKTGTITIHGKGKGKVLY